MRLYLSLVPFLAFLAINVSDHRAFADEPVDEHTSGLPLVFSEDFEPEVNPFETTDGDNFNHVFGMKRRKSDYEPKHRSPHNIALIKGIEVTDFVLTFKVRSTKDTGGHRDCCVFFCHTDPEHFYYAHLGAVPDPHSGQIMIVNDAPRKAITNNKKKVPWDDEWHVVKVVRDSLAGTIEVYFDDMDKVHMHAVDRSFGKGRVGIGSFDDMNDFDDIKLYGR